MFEIHHCQNCNKAMKIHSDYKFKVITEFCSKDCETHYKDFVFKNLKKGDKPPILKIQLPGKEYYNTNPAKYSNMSGNTVALIFGIAILAPLCFIGLLIIIFVINPSC